MRILVVTQKVDRGDTLLGFFHYWVEEIAKLVDEVTVIGLGVGAHALPPNVKVLSLGKEHGASKLLQALRFYWYSLKVLPKVDGIFVHMAPEYVRALYPLNIFFRKPTVMWYAHIKVSPIASWAMKHVNFVLTPSQESFALDSSKVVSTGHGINTDLFKPQPSQELGDVLALSRISKVKRIETLIEATKILKSKGLSLKVNIYGDPARPEDKEYLESLKRKVKEFGLEQMISWQPGVANTDAPAVYAGHKVFVRLQGGGGFGKTELEAMATGLPAIVPTPVYKTDLAEWAEDLYFAEDDAEALAGCLERVLAWSGERKKAYATASRALVQNKHNVKHVAVEIVRLLQSCVA